MEKQEKGVGLLALDQVASRVSVRGPGGKWWRVREEE